MLPLTTVTLMLIVPTLLGASSVHVTKDTLEMEPLAMVNFHTKLTMAFIIMWCSGPPNSPVMLSTSPQSTSITLTWSQSPGDVVDSYQISYSFTIRGCGMGGGHVSTVNGSSREYTLTGLEENSDFTINITAMNGAGSSPPARNTTKTLETSEFYIILELYSYVIYLQAPTALGLMISSTSPTTISLSWGEVPCKDKNVDRITGYQIVYNTTSDNVIRGRGNDSTTMFTANSLIPRTNYTFEVNARHDGSTILNGPPAIITGVTEVPQG